MDLVKKKKKNLDGVKGFEGRVSSHPAQFSSPSPGGQLNNNSFLCLLLEMFSARVSVEVIAPFLCIHVGGIL